MPVDADVEWRNRLREERAHQGVTDALDSILRIAEAHSDYYPYYALKREVEEIRRLCERSSRPTHI